MAAEQTYREMRTGSGMSKKSKYASMLLKVNEREGIMEDDFKELLEYFIHKEGDETGGTPLHDAVLYGAVRRVELLLKFGAKSFRDWIGRTPLDIAKMQYHDYKNHKHPSIKKKNQDYQQIIAMLEEAEKKES